MSVPEELRADLLALVDLATVVAAGMTDRAYGVVDTLLETPAVVSDPAACLAAPSAEVEAALGTARQAQRSAAGVAQTLDQLRGVLQRHALALVLDGDSNDPATGVRTVLWLQLRGVIDEVSGLVDRLVAISLTAAGPGPMDPPAAVPKVSGLAELLAEVRSANGHGAGDP